MYEPRKDLPFRLRIKYAVMSDLSSAVPKKQSCRQDFQPCSMSNSGSSLEAFFQVNVLGLSNDAQIKSAASRLSAAERKMVGVDKFHNFPQLRGRGKAGLHVMEEFCTAYSERARRLSGQFAKLG